LKIRDRSSYERKAMSAAAGLQIDKGIVRAARVASGGAGTRPSRMRAVEAALVGRRPERSVLETAACTASQL
jgi:xanthine dehydrogenase YagS FAD-binding subunit